MRRGPKRPKRATSASPREKARWDRRLEDSQTAIRCAHIMGCDKVRVFAGTRVADPTTIYQRIADKLGELSKLAEREKVYFLLENEGSQNVATSQELADVMKLIPSKWVGFNWDPNNAYGMETAYPDGYNALPKERMLNLQIKGQRHHASQSRRRIGGPSSPRSTTMATRTRSASRPTSSMAR